MGDERGEDRRGADVEDHHAQPGAELREEEHRQDQPVRPAGERHEHERHREDDAAEDVRRPDPDPPPEPRRHEGADQPADGAGAEDDPERRRPHVQRANGVQDEERVEDEVEEVDRRRGEERGAHDRRGHEVAHARHDVPLLGHLDLRLDGIDRGQEPGREEKRDRVDEQRVRRLQQLHEDAPHARPCDERERAAAREQRVCLHVFVPLDERHEERRVGDEEEDRHRPHEEGNDVQLLDRQRVDRIGERNRHEQGGAGEVGEDHRLPPATAAVDPGTGVEREEQVRHELGGHEVAHLLRVRVQHEDRGQRDREQRDLVAEERDRLARPDAPEDEVLAQDAWDEPSHRRRSAARATRVASRSLSEPTPRPFHVSTVTTKAPLSV